jgi:metallophosphoesterase superfamily enzyme
MSIPLNKHTNLQLRVRINKGQKTLDTAHKIMFAAWHQAYVADAGRTVSSFTKAQLIDVLTHIVELYKAQQVVNAGEDFDTKTSTLRERTMARARNIRLLMNQAKDEAIATGKAVKVKMERLRS